uniref:Col_cuticle_N domain-containing protein n=1 Tax=Globodera pallida TaxID=36090 RepID=A0A183C763_GLOPA
MQETQIVVGVASVCSLLAIVATLVVVPSLYSQINEISLKVHDGVQAFRVNTDSAWNELMEVQITVTPPAKPRENPFASIFRSKRQLPGHCQCAGVPPDSLDSPDTTEKMESLERQDNPEPRVRMYTAHANNVRQDPRANLEDRGQLGHLACLESRVNPDMVEVWARRDHLDQLDNPELLANLENWDSQDNPDSQALLARTFPVRKARPVHPELLDSPGHRDDLESLETRERPERLAHPDILANPARPDNLVIPELLEHPAKMPSTALAHHAAALMAPALAPTLRRSPLSRRQ